MRILPAVLFLLFLAFLPSCDLRSGTAKKNMEKYIVTPTPPILPPPTEPPVDAADIIEVDTNLQGETVSIDGDKQVKTANCLKFNRVMVNGNDNRITIRGACRQIMVNGDGNEITADASLELVFNGSLNVIKYSRYPNGKRPTVTQNRAGNVTEKIAPNTQPAQKNKK
jgi:hypothetical protein